MTMIASLVTTVFPRIVSAETSLLWICKILIISGSFRINLRCNENLNSFLKSVWKLFNGGNYLRKYSLYMLAFLFLHSFCIYRNDESFTQLFCETLANEVNFESFYFECPPVNAKNMNEKSFEFVVVNSGTLHKRRPDPDAFAEHFKDRCLTSVSPNFHFLSIAIHYSNKTWLSGFRKSSQFYIYFRCLTI